MVYTAYKRLVIFNLYEWRHRLQLYRSSSHLFIIAITTPSSQNVQCCHASYILLGGTHPPILQLSTVSFLFLCLFPFSLPNVNFKELTHAMEKPLKCSKQTRAVGTHFNESKYNFFTNPPISVSALKMLFSPILEKHSSPCYMRPKPWILTRASF